MGFNKTGIIKFNKTHTLASRNNLPPFKLTCSIFGVRSIAFPSKSCYYLRVYCGVNTHTDAFAMCTIRVNTAVLFMFGFCWWFNCCVRVWILLDACDVSSYVEHFVHRPINTLNMLLRCTLHTKLIFCVICVCVFCFSFIRSVFFFGFLFVLYNGWSQCM